MSQPHSAPNHLIHSTSPYLLQHAYNPVDWYSWGTEALEKAVKEDKPVILSIGYSSCHWCHVMERESFESDEIASIMNSNFIAIKVDREERPDIDQVYMEAVQAMGINGGWPLNVFLTPDQKPFYGGTYFRPAAWKQLLINISESYKNQRKEIFESAEKFCSFIGESELKKFKLSPDGNFNFEELADAMGQLAEKFDAVHGGFTRAPKFPMPNLWRFVMQHAYIAKNKNTLDHVFFTLHKMAMGGIYDQAGGGFARYATDARWFAPHFEKMLYDNAQLLSLYSEAYRLNPDPLYKEIVVQTIEFLKLELMDTNGGFYSALDADSEGEEGKYYTWTENEINSLSGDRAGILKAYWGISKHGNWENGFNILHKTIDDASFCRDHKITADELSKILADSRKILMNARGKRIRPSLDNKIISGWNGLMIKGLTDAYLAFKIQDYLDLAIRTAEHIMNKTGINGVLPRTLTNNNQSPEGYLDDYAFVTDALISLYFTTFNEKWIDEAKKLTDYALNNFYDEKEELFYYTGSGSENLIARKKEIFDNVTPGSNSVMAMNLYKLGLLLDHEPYREVAIKMVSRIKSLLVKEPEYLFYWGSLYSFVSKPMAEIAVVGPDYKNIAFDITYDYNPAKVVMATEHNSRLSIFEGRESSKGDSIVYVCYNKSCRLPVQSAEEALKLLE